jgi:hypothetical protein
MRFLKEEKEKSIANPRISNTLRSTVLPENVTIKFVELIHTVSQENVKSHQTIIEPFINQPQIVNLKSNEIIINTVEEAFQWSIEHPYIPTNYQINFPRKNAKGLKREVRKRVVNACFKKGWTDNQIR